MGLQRDKRIKLVVAHSQFTRKSIVSLSQDLISSAAVYPFLSQVQPVLYNLLISSFYFSEGDFSIFFSFSLSTTIMISFTFYVSHMPHHIVQIVNG